MVQSARYMDVGLEAKLVEYPRIVVSKVNARYSLRRNLNFGELVSSDAVKSFVYLL